MLFCLAFEALRVDSNRRRVGGADLPRDLLIEGHAGDEARLCSAAPESGIFTRSTVKCRAKARRYMKKWRLESRRGLSKTGPNSGASCAGD